MKRFALGTKGSRNVYVDTQRLVDTRLLIQANSGGGKSWCLRRILEQTHGQLQHLVIDLEGEFSSLRQKFDYVLAAKSGGDTAAQPRAAKLLAERLLELGVSAILDIYELKAPERVEFVKNFLTALVDAPKKLWHPALVVVDEAHVFCPEKGSAESAPAVIDLATRGRKRGFCAVLATQRLAKLHKDAAAECNNKLIGRTGLDVDLRRAGDELGISKNEWTALRQLDEGEFWAFGPAISRSVELVHVGGVSTKHPKAGARLTFTAPAPTAKVRALLPKLADLPAEAEARAQSIADLKRLVAELERKLANKPDGPRVVEVPVFSEKDRQSIDAAAQKVVTGLADVKRGLGNASDELTRIFDDISNIFGGVRKAMEASAVSSKKTAMREREPSRFSMRGHHVGPPASNGVVKLKEGERRMLDALARRHPARITKGQLGTLARLKTRGGTWRTYFGNLKKHRLIEIADNRIGLSDRGIEHIGTERVADLATTDSSELIEMWSSTMKRGERVMFHALVDCYPRALSKDELAAHADMTAEGGTWRTYFGHLKSNGLIEVDGDDVRASQTLFD